MDLLEEEAVLLAQNAVNEGLVSGTEITSGPVPDAPESAVVTLGGKNCKWCGSTTHSCKTHTDCPHNPRNAPTI